jgi:benzoyl-CoA 2,3-dioxygenase component B
MISHELIPNNVDLSSNKRLQRALEHWQPRYLDWWHEMGPRDFQQYHQVYLRTAVSVESDGWCHYAYVRMPEYRWGIFLAPPLPDRTIGFGDFFGQPAWKEVPGEFRNPLKRLIVLQGDTEPASVEQQRLLGHSCPSLYDLRNIFQVNVEEGRHLWAMVYLLHTYFGRDGRDEAEEMLERSSGDQDKPRMLEAFNEPIDDWLDFFMFAMFTDRDGKSQLMSLAESALDPLSRTTRFMLTEEAHHLFVGESGVSRILQRTCELMKQSGAGLSGDVRRVGGIDLPTLQKHLNFWFSQSVDLHGSEISTNAATYFANGLKGRAKEDSHAEHRALHQSYQIDVLEDGEWQRRSVPLRNAMNEVLRDWYIGDCEAGVARWNKVLERHGLSDRFYVPSRRFNRRIGIYAGMSFDPKGHPVSKEEWEARRFEWLPSPDDKAYLRHLMSTPVYETGKFANWIAAPVRGINRLPVDFEYVRTEGP